MATEAGLETLEDLLMRSNDTLIRKLINNLLQTEMEEDISMNSLPKIEGLRVRVVRAPMKEPHKTASGVITESPLVLTDISSDTGITGHSIVFTYTPAALKPTADLIHNFGSLVEGEILAPTEIEQKLSKRFRLLGTQGLVGMALAAI